MSICALDTETYLIGPTVPAPPLVVGSYADDCGSSGLIPGLDVGSWFIERLRAGVTFVGANFVYDTFVLAQEWPEYLPEILAAYDRGVLRDVRLREVLIDIRKGTYRKEEYEDESGVPHTRPIGYSLGEIAFRRCGIQLNKGPDSWRLRYNELHGLPLADWPREATEYAIDDAVATLRVYESQENEAGEYLSKTEPDQCRTSFSLRHIGTRGLLVDIDSLDALETHLRTKRDALQPALVEAGVCRASGTKNMARLRDLVSAAYARRGEPAPTTDKGEVKTSAAVLKESGDALLEQLAEQSKYEKLLTSFVPGMRIGAQFPLTCEYTPILETGRTSCQGIRYGKQKGPQVQNLPRGL